VDQHKLDFPPTEDEPRRRRYRRRKPLPPRRRPPQPATLTVPPVVQPCGLCGHRQTLLGETAVCAACGAIIIRREDEE